MAGNKGHGGGIIPVGYGDSGIGGRGGCRSNPGNYFKSKIFLGKGFYFLSSPAKNKGISSFQADNHFSGLGMFHQELINSLLGVGMQSAAFFPRIDKHRIFWCISE